jgi:hypothetical protein
MQSRRLSLFLWMFVALWFGFPGAFASAATPEFTITATNVTMPSSGLGISKFTVTSIPMSGTITLSCTYAGASTAAKVPICPMTPPVAYQVNAGGTLTGTIYFYPYGSAVPAGLPLGPGRWPGHVPAAGAALAGALLLGLGFRRRARRWLVLAVFALGTLAGMLEISACGGSSNAMTPGTYPFTITADNESGSVTPLGRAVSTTINVTVP